MHFAYNSPHTPYLGYASPVDSSDWTASLWMYVAGFFVYRFLMWVVVYIPTLWIQQEGDITTEYFWGILLGAWPHAFAAIAYSELFSAPAWRYYIPVYLWLYFPLAIWTQLYTWWLPYLFRWGKPYNDIEHWMDCHRDDIHIWPKLPGREVVPNLDITILTFTTVLLWMVCIIENSRKAKVRRQKRL